MALARQPGLVLEHADAYVDLASAELDEWGTQWKHRAGLNSAAALMVAGKAQDLKQGAALAAECEATRLRDPPCTPARAMPRDYRVITARI